MIGRFRVQGLGCNIYVQAIPSGRHGLALVFVKTASGRFFHPMKDKHANLDIEQVHTSPRFEVLLSWGKPISFIPQMLCNCLVGNERIDPCGSSGI